MGKQRKKELKQLVKENSYIECTQENYEEAKRRRTALRKGRTVVQNDVKMICSQLAGVSRGVKDAGDQLILIVQKAEDKQQYSVGAFEDEKERIRQEKIRLEQERKDKLKEEILSWMEGMNDQIGQAQNSKDLEKLKNEILLVAVSEEAQSEFANDIAWTKTQLELTFNNRIAQIELQEQRAEQEKLRKEKEALERKAEQERLEREKIELKQKAEQEKIQREKEELEQKLKDAEQAKQELIKKVENSGTKEETHLPNYLHAIPTSHSLSLKCRRIEFTHCFLFKLWLLRVLFIFRTNVPLYVIATKIATTEQHDP